MGDVDSRFVRKIPKVFVEDGHILVQGSDALFVWTPHLFTAFVVEAQRVLSEWRASQQPPVPLPIKAKRQQH